MGIEAYTNSHAPTTHNTRCVCVYNQRVSVRSLGTCLKGADINLRFKTRILRQQRSASQALAATSWMGACIKKKAYIQPLETWKSMSVHVWVDNSRQIFIDAVLFESGAPVPRCRVRGLTVLGILFAYTFREIPTLRSPSGTSSSLATSTKSMRVERGSVSPQEKKWVCLRDFGKIPTCMVCMQAPLSNAVATGSHHQR